MSDDPTDFNDLYGEPSNRGSASVSNEDGKPNPATTRIVGVLGLIALGLAFYTITGGFKSSPQETTDNSQQQLASNKSSVAKSNNIVADKIEEVTGMNVSGISDMTNIDWGSEEKKAVNKAAVLALLDKMNELETARLKMQEVGAGVMSRLEGMKSSETGSKIAADKSSVAQYVVLLAEAENAMKEDVEVTVFLSEINSLLKKWEAAGDWKYEPQPFVLERLDLFLQRTDDRQKELTVLDDAIVGLVATTKENQPGTLLASAISERATEGQESIAKRLAKVAEESRESAIKKMEDEVRESESALAESLAKLDTTAVLARAHENNKKVADLLRAIEEDKQAVALAEKKRLQEQQYIADQAAIQVYLVPFISQGRELRGDLGGTGPMSYGVIVSSGGLDDSNQGLRKLEEIAKYRNDRAKGGLPGGDNPRGVQNFLLRAQALLKKHGEYMVEKGILAK